MKHAGSRYKDYPSFNRMGLKPPVRSVAMIQTWRHTYGPRGEEMPHMTVEMRGAVKVMVRRVVDPFCGTFCKDYTLQWEEMGGRLNGRCYDSLVLTINEPDLHRLGVGEWVPLIKDRMERLFLCRVKVFTDYNQWLNA